MTRPPSPAVRLGPASTVAIIALSLIGVAAFGWPLLTQEFHKTRRIGELVIVELQRCALWPGIDAADPGAFAHRLDPNDQHQRVDLFRDRAEPVDQLLLQDLKLVKIGCVCKAFVQCEPLMNISAIVTRQ